MQKPVYVNFKVIRKKFKTKAPRTLIPRKRIVGNSPRAEI